MKFTVFSFLKADYKLNEVEIDFIDQELYETMDEAYRRGYIINNIQDCPSPHEH